MALTAENKQGLRVLAPELEDKQQDFYCRFCKNPMSFVDAQLKVKHFRHKVETSCDSEPETEEHEYYKLLVYNKLRSMKFGEVHLEYPVGRHRADIYWDRGARYHIGIEIQATNYSLAEYEAKIKNYALRHLIVVYMFIGDNFCNEVRKNVYSLKEIEKRIFHEKTYLDTVIACYLNGNTVIKPSFKEKFAKGGRGFCSDRFIMSKRDTEEMLISDYLDEVHSYAAVNKYRPVCLHDVVAYEKSQGTIPRYKAVCVDCLKFVKWLPNKEAQAIGLDI